VSEQKREANTKVVENDAPSKGEKASAHIST